MNLSSRSRVIKRLLESKAYRDAYVLEHIKNGVAFQIRTLREDRDWTQGELGEIAKKPSNVISRLEDPNYGKFTLTTLLEIASAFDVGLLVKFVPFSRLAREYDDVTPPALSANSISEGEEILALNEWAAADSTTSLTAETATQSDGLLSQTTGFNRLLRAVEPVSTETSKTRSVSKKGTYQPLPLFDRPISLVEQTEDVVNPSTSSAISTSYEPGESVIKTA